MYREKSKKSEIVSFYEHEAEDWFTIEEVVSNTSAGYETARLFLEELVDEDVLVRNIASEPHEFRHSDSVGAGDSDG